MATLFAPPHACFQSSHMAAGVEGRNEIGSVNDHILEDQELWAN